MQRNVSKIDPKLNLGLHELGNPREKGSFKFQLGNAKQQIKDILENFDSLIENTRTKAPVRDAKKDFMLCRGTNPTRELRHEEVKWERAMHQKWGPEGSGEFVQVCKRIQTYQYPLKVALKDECWGKIDLLGIGNDGLPVPIELKKAKTDDSPLRMVVEVAAYGFAILKVWPNLREHWAKALSISQSNLREELERVTLVCVAPKEYWCSCMGRPGMDPGAFPTEAWPCFWHLVDRLKPWFDIHFAALHDSGNYDETGKPEINRAEELNLRSLTMNSAVGTSDSPQ